MNSGNLEQFGAYKKSLVIEARVTLAEEISRILSATIVRLAGH